MTSTDNRAEFTAGLRALADLLDNHPDLPLPFHGARTEMLWIETGSDTVDTARTFARLIPGTIDQRANDAFDLYGRVHGLRVQMILNRDAICERVVTGTREVTREVPDPEALAAVPTTTVTKTVEDVEWVCRPLLADEAVSA